MFAGASIGGPAQAIEGGELMSKARCLSRLWQQRRWRAGPAERKGSPLVTFGPSGF